MSAGGKVSLNQLVFRNLYFRYNAFVAPVSTIIVCIFLFWFVVIPQMQSWFQLRDDLTVNQQDLQVMHQNLTTITALDDASLNQMLTTATDALPAEKDFEGIVSSIQNAAAISGASLGDYAFQLGDLSGLDSAGKPSQLPLQLNVLLKGDIASAQRFAIQLKKQLPLSDTVALSVNGNESITATVVFYYASLPKIVFQDSNPLPVLGTSDKQLLADLATGANLQNVELSGPTATPSAKPSLTPTVSPSLSPTPTIATTPTPAASGSAR